MERPLSGMERMMYLQSASDNAFTCARIRGPLDEAALRRALDRLQRRYPLLGARVIRKDGRLTFTTEAVSPIPLRLTFDEGRGQSFLKIIEEELVSPLDRTTGPLIRCTLVRHPGGARADLILTVDHTIADGTSCLHAIRDLLTPERASEGESGPTALPSPITDLIPASFIDAGPPPLPPREVPPSSVSTFSVSTTGPRLFSTELAREPMQRLAHHCRQQGTTVYTAVCAAFGAAFAEVFDRRTRVTISSPVTLRPRLGPCEREAFSCCIGFTRFHVDVSPGSAFWEQAHAVQRQLLEGTTDPRLLGPLAAIEAAHRAEHDDDRFLRRVSPRGEGHDLSITNLGRQPIPSHYGERTLEALYGGTGLPGEVVIGLNTLEDTMHVTFSLNGLSSEENDAVHRMVASALSRLRALLQ